MQIRQEYTVAIASLTTDTTTFLQVDTAALDGTVTYYFELSFKPSNAAPTNTHQWTLRRKGTATDDATITADGVNTIFRVSFTPPASAQTEYIIHNVSADSVQYNARIIALQSGFTKTQAQFTIGHASNGSFTTTSTTLTEGSQRIWKYTAANWNGTNTFSWEIVWKSDSTMNTQTAEFQTFNGTLWSAVGSDITTTSTTAVRTRTTFTPTDGNLYRVVVKTSATTHTVTVYDARIIVTQTATPTKMELQYLIEGDFHASDNTGTLSKWDLTEWIGVSNTYQFSLESDSVGNSETAELRDASNTQVSGSSVTVGATDSITISSGFAMPSSQNVHSTQTVDGHGTASRIIVAVISADEIAASGRRVFELPLKRSYPIYFISSNAAVFATTVVFDNASISTYEAALSQYTFNIAIANKTNRVLLVGVAIFASGSVQSIDAGGSAMTFVRADINGVYRSEIWRLFAPPTGTVILTVNLSTSLTSIANAASYYNSDQSALDANTGGTGTGNPASKAITTIADKSTVFASLATSTASGVTSGASQNARTSNNGALGTGASADFGDVTPAGSKTMQWSGIGSFDTWALSVVSIQPPTPDILLGQISV